MQLLIKVLLLRKIYKLRRLPLNMHIKIRKRMCYLLFLAMALNLKRLIFENVPTKVRSSFTLNQKGSLHKMRMS